MEITLEPQSTDYFSRSGLLLGKLFRIPPEKIFLINLLGNFGDLCINESEVRSQLSPERNKGWIYEPALPGLENVARVLHHIAEMAFPRRWGGHVCVDCN